MFRKSITKLESRRLTLQTKLDREKNAAERNRMGQFSTPNKLAVDILRYANSIYQENDTVRFIDPAFGTGSFYSALLDVFPSCKIGNTVGYEIDPHYGKPTTELWGETGLNLYVQDFTKAEEPKNDEKFNLLICNPPYVRHHHIANGDKRRLKRKTLVTCGVEINGLAGLYCYYLGLSHSWMSEGGLAGWLIPSEFMDVNYGSSVKHYLLDKVKLLQIHRFDPNETQFEDALVSSVVVWFRKEPVPLNHEVLFTFGGSLEQPKLKRYVSIETLRSDPKWTRYPTKERYERPEGPVLSDFFEIKRGLVTGNNRFFILSADEIKSRELPMEMFRPILPSPRYLAEDLVVSDEKGNPELNRRLFLLDCQMEEHTIERRHPKLWAYLEEGKAQGIADRYLCKHRAPWYSQERRPPAPFLCTYLGRSDNRTGRPFRFILNNSAATAANVYLMLYPKLPIESVLTNSPQLRKQVWESLNRICPQKMLSEGRVYGGGLHKLEPKELGNVPAEEVAELLSEISGPPQKVQGELFDF